MGLYGTMTRYGAKAAHLAHTQELQVQVLMAQPPAQTVWLCMCQIARRFIKEEQSKCISVEELFTDTNPYTQPTF